MNEWLRNHQFLPVLLAWVLAFVVLSICGYIYENKYDACYEEALNKAISEALADNSLQMKVSYSKKCMNYNHLGTDLETEFDCNGREVGQNAVVPYNERLNFTVIIRESDPSCDDYGRGDVTMQLPPYAQTVKTYVHISESGGGNRWKDGYADFEVSITAEPYFENPVKPGVFKVLFY